MAKTQERIKTNYKAMEESRGMVQQCECCKVRYRAHEVRPLCSDCEEQQVEQEVEEIVAEETIIETEKTPVSIEDARVTDLTDTIGAAAILGRSDETVRQLVFQKQLRCFCFVEGVLTEGNAKGRSALFLRDDVKALPPRVWGWPAGKARKVTQ